MKIDVVTCSCGCDLLRFEMLDLNDNGMPEVAISMWGYRVHKDNRPNFWQRLKNAWKEFRGTLTHDEICFTDKNKLIEMRDIVEELIERWEDMQKSAKKTKKGKKT